MSKLISILNNDIDALIFAEHRNYERDMGTLLEMYSDIEYHTNRFPKFSEIYEEIESYNQGVANDITRDMMYSYNTEADTYDYAATNTMNEILIKKLGCNFNEKIYEILLNSNIVFENDYQEHPLHYHVKKFGGTHKIINNLGIMVMFEELSVMHSIDPLRLSGIALESIGDSIIVRRNNNETT